MGKYIIELERGETAYKTVNSNGKPMIQLLAPTPYTDPDLEQVRKEAYERGHENGYSIGYDEGHEAGIQAGMCDAWETARKIVDCAIPYEALENYLEIGECTADVIKHLPASKAIEVARQYEQRQEEQDGLRQNIQTIVDQCGYTLDEIASVLEKMRESE